MHQITPHFLKKGKEAPAAFAPLTSMLMISFKSGRNPPSGGNSRGCREITEDTTCDMFVRLASERLTLEHLWSYQGDFHQLGFLTVERYGRAGDTLTLCPDVLSHWS